MTVYPVGYIEQLARPFRRRSAINEERTHAQRGHPREQRASDAVPHARHASQLTPRRRHPDGVAIA